MDYIIIVSLKHVLFVGAVQIKNSNITTVITNDYTLITREEFGAGEEVPVGRGPDGLDRTKPRMYEFAIHGLALIPDRSPGASHYEIIRRRYLWFRIRTFMRNEQIEFGTVGHGVLAQRMLIGQIFRDYRIQSDSGLFGRTRRLLDQRLRRYSHHPVAVCLLLKS
jgi:hypothetical protein